MLSPSDFNSAVPKFQNGNYANNPIDPSYIEEPSMVDYNRGVEPLDTLPAQWWNWLCYQFTVRFNKLNTYVKNIFDELTQFLSLLNVTPDGTESVITTGQLKNAFKELYPAYVSSKLELATTYTPQTRTINGKSLTSNVTLTGADVNVSSTNTDTIAEELDELYGRHSTDITSLLQSGGYIRLAKGTYTISQPIVLPVHTMIEGCGKDTVIICSAISNSYAFTLTSNCCIKSLLFEGGNGPNIPGADGGQDCIVIGQTNTPANNVLIDDVYIEEFSGYGIKGVKSSGYTIYSDPIRITRTQVSYCFVGVAFGVPCQYVQVSDCTFAHNNFGCANQDGNNLFVNCQFNGNTIGYYMNGSESPNWNAHGAVTGCQFNHNTQYSIWLTNISAGQIFTGCVVFYGSLLITGSKQVQFVGCEFSWLDADSFQITSCTGTCVLANNIIERKTTSITLDIANIVMFNNKLSDGTELAIGTETPTTSNSGNTIVKRYADGSIEGQWIISNAPVYSDADAPSVGSLPMFDTSGYLSKVSYTHFQKLIGVVPDIYNTPNTVVKRDADGYIRASYIHSAISQDNDKSASSIYFEYNNDGFIRKCSIDRAKQILSVFSFDSSTGTLTITQP